MKTANDFNFISDERDCSYDTKGIYFRIHVIKIKEEGNMTLYPDLCESTTNNLLYLPLSDGTYITRQVQDYAELKLRSHV
jgi:hypothetical protein